MQARRRFIQMRSRASSSDGASLNSSPRLSPRPERIEKKPKTPLKRWKMEDVVGLYAGGDEAAKPMNLHKDIACYYSPVFKAAFNSRFQEGESQTYRLDDVEPNIVRLMIHWMYQQELDIGIVHRKQKSAMDLTLCKLWVLADRLMIPSLQNLAIRKIEQQRNRFRATSTNCLDYVYEHTVAGSPLRRLFTEYCAFHVLSERFDERPEHFPKEALIDIVKMLSAEVTQHRKDQVVADREMENFEVDDVDDEVSEVLE